ncbi:MAG: hypothetical protein K2Q01_12210 [Rickettsiales bacterium]|nr:hypothetical protein [Rickettsiales bacterium]
MHGESAEENTLAAFEHALSLGYGIEVDIRDHDGALVVARDPGALKFYPFSALCELLSHFPDSTAAINIKACGLQHMLKQALDRYNITRYFTFDMATPDLLANLRHGLQSYTRQSEYEPEPVFYRECTGVWLDMLENDWVGESSLAGHARRGKDVAIVSPELHQRPHAAFWQSLKRILGEKGLSEHMNFYLCTDFPQAAERFFHD